jgi:hypothetical protein
VWWPACGLLFLRIRPLNSAGRFFDSANWSSTSDTATINRAMLSSHPFGDGSLGASVTLGRCAGLMK